MKRKIIAIALLGFMGAFSAAMYLYYKPHQEMKSLRADHTVSAGDLYHSFVQDEEAARTKYEDKIVQVKGVVKEIHPSDTGEGVLILEVSEEMFGVSCALESSQLNLLDKITVGDQVEIKGLCTGMLMDVNLSRCIIANS